MEKYTTPRPWRLGGCSGRMIVTSSNQTVADVDILVNADLIITAVNAWDSIEALEARIAELRAADDRKGDENANK